MLRGFKTFSIIAIQLVFIQVINSAQTDSEACNSCCTAGVPGIPGHHGNPGIPGSQGVNGEKGMKGGQGEKGEQGMNGEEGMKGDNGIKGGNGRNGLDGIPGKLGPTGPQGLIGPPGANGVKGEKGMNGEQGLNGENGMKGKKGITGEQGMKGEQGDNGQNGLDGIPGKLGPEGRPGSKGIRGFRGYRGFIGLKGQKGEQREDTNITSQYESAFTAVFKSNPGRPIGPLKYDTVITNVGNHYYNETGKFYCEIPGVYVFQVTSRSGGGNGVITRILQNGHIRGSVRMRSSSESASTMVILDLVSGDQVWTQPVNSSYNYYYSDINGHCSFSGFLLYAA